MARREAHRRLRRTGQLAARARTDQRPGHVHRRIGHRPDRGTRAVPAAGWWPGGFGGPDGDHLGAAGTGGSGPSAGGKLVASAAGTFGQRDRGRCPAGASAPSRNSAAGAGRRGSGNNRDHMLLVRWQNPAHPRGGHAGAETSGHGAGQTAGAFLKPSTVHDAFAQDLSEADRWLIVASQRPITLGANTAPTQTAAWKTIPSWAVVGTEDRVIPPATQRSMAERAGSIDHRSRGIARIDGVPPCGCHRSHPRSRRCHQRLIT